MTLDNLKYALILNNKLLLDRLKTFLHTHDNLPTLNGLSANNAGALLFNGNLVNEQYAVTDEEIKAMVDQVIAELDKETGGSTDPTPPGSEGDSGGTDTNPSGGDSGGGADPNQPGEGGDNPVEPNTHHFSTEWTSDEINHWHVCTDENCTEIFDSAAHSWNEGIVTKEPGIGVAGEKTFTCTVCSKTRIETIDPLPVELYCYKKTIAESNPDTRIAYAENNANFTPVKMNFETGTFEYGDWADAFFMKLRPVMLNFDGTVAYDLDPSNYSRKKDGSDSDITNVNFNGNAMLGIPTIWFKRETIDGYEYVYVSNKKIDDTYKAYAHTDEDGNIMKYTYIPIYNGFIDSSGKLRSISGVTPTCDTTMTQEITAAELNNPSGKHMWNIETRADIQMLIDLCTLISKSSNSQTAFGNGNISGGQSNVKATGTMNDKGLFYGTNTKVDGVKVFGIEHFWGNRFGRVIGSIYANNIMKVKMTYGTQDGSSVTGYNQDGTGYITINDTTMPSTPNKYRYISKTFNNEYGRFIKEANGTENTYDCDVCTFVNITGIELRGGFCTDDVKCGCNIVNFSVSSSTAYYSFGASCSCKPNVQENILISAT